MEHAVTFLVRVLRLVIAVHATSPSIPLDRVAVASFEAVRAETDRVPAEIVATISAHESDLQPRAVSWRDAGGKRVDKVVVGVWEIPARGPYACGMMQTVAGDRARCAALLDPAKSMAAGVAELAEELALTRGEMGAALAAYAGGRRGLAAWRAGEETDATRFSRLFLWRARQLGWRSAGSAS